MKQTETLMSAKPFVKWAGGKTQLLPFILETLKAKVDVLDRFSYVEPFAGSGAVMFAVLREFQGKINRVVLNEINSDLVLTYRVLRDFPEELLAHLASLKSEYLGSIDEASRKAVFEKVRSLFNKREAEDVWQAAYLIFLNKTCFNGLYRVNSKDQFNVPHGRYKNPAIFDLEAMHATSELLQNVEIFNTDYESILSLVKEESNVIWYLDPPYRPLSKSSAFVSYSANPFADDEQFRLKAFCDKLHQNNHWWLLSNSDPKNMDESDEFFDDLYKDYHIKRVKARRSINSNALKRGRLFELLISNF